MAIVQASLAEDILSKPEKAVLRGIYRASQLSEALAILDKISVALTSAGSAPTSKWQRPSDTDEIKNLKQYLSSQIVRALVSTKVPASSAQDSEVSKQNQPESISP